ncbi:MAG TPA: anhydro-N-acetylmuramic acid kinase [Terriglobales bacterium]|nr:anhydro-N-acetylmuramic acid kinase [Terriglobales bacterium]
MIVAGVMSGTSADGINVAIVRLLGRGAAVRFSLLAEEQFEYPIAIRKAVLAAMNAPAAKVADLSRLNFLLGEMYAKAVLTTKKRHDITKLELIGCHGQTIYHQGEAVKYLGADVACTWQTGEGSIVAQRTGTPVVSDFRIADMAAGGQGAPLVPMLDYVVYRHRTRGRILQNIGGIGNLTAIPSGAKFSDLRAFDTGPGNMVIDACMEKLYGQRYDKRGRIGALGRPMDNVISDLLRASYFRMKPPKSAGREEFGGEFLQRFLKKCGRAGKEDIIATATALTAQSIAQQVRMFVTNKSVGHYKDFVVAGGGSKNPTLMRMLAAELGPGLTVRDSAEYGVPAESKEAIAFALLAYLTWNRQPGNVPSATGAKKAVILGKISYA